MFPEISPAVRTLILINVLIFGVQMTDIGYVFTLEHFALWPIDSQASLYSAPFRPWQLITYGFMHDPGRYSHIIFNMFGLFMFGSDVERSMGLKKFLTYFFICVVGAALTQLAAMAIGFAPRRPVLGASGALFGVLLAYAIAFPHRKLIVFPIPVPISSRMFVTLYAGFELWMGFSGLAQGVAHFAHLGGALAGYLLILYWRHAPR